MVPPPGREVVIQQLHGSHPSITRMKALAQMYIWWPGILADIGKSARLCQECQQVRQLFHWLHFTPGAGLRGLGLKYI